MFKFLPDLEGDGRMFPFSWGTASVYPITGVTIPAYWPSAVNRGEQSWRSDLDSLRTGPREAFGDHECRNVQLSADVQLHASAVTGDVAPFDPVYGIPAGDVHAPPDINGYRLDDVAAAFGWTWAANRTWQYRVSSLNLVLNGILDMPLQLVRDGWVRSYGAGLRKSSVGRILIEESVLATRLVFPNGSTQPFVYRVLLSWTKVYKENHALASSSPTLSIHCTSMRPKTSTSSTARQWSLNSSNVWVNSTVQAPIPQFLQSISRGQFETYLANPALLTAELPWGALACTNVPLWGGSLLPSMSKSVTSVVDTSPERIQSIVTELGTFASHSVQYYSSVKERVDWVELADTAVDNCQQVGINCAAYAMDLKKVLSTLKSTVLLTHDWQDPKAWASWWLSLRYGDRLTFADTSELARGVIRDIRSKTRRWFHDWYVVRSMDNLEITSPAPSIPSCTIQAHLKTYYRPRKLGWFGDVYRWAVKWDIWPSTANAWDLIPFSFVVDWFVDVGKLLEDADRATTLMYYDVLSVLTSTLTCFTVDPLPTSLDYSTEGVDVRIYHRYRSSSLPSAPFRIDRGHSSTINIVDGTSLVIQVLS